MITDQDKLFWAGFTNHFRPQYNGWVGGEVSQTSTRPVFDRLLQLQVIKNWLVGKAWEQEILALVTTCYLIAHYEQSDVDFDADRSALYIGFPSQIFLTKSGMEILGVWLTTVQQVARVVSGWQEEESCSETEESVTSGSQQLELTWLEYCNNHDIAMLQGNGHFT